MSDQRATPYKLARSSLDEHFRLSYNPKVPVTKPPGYDVVNPTTFELQKFWYLSIASYGRPVAEKVSADIPWDSLLQFLLDEPGRYHGYSSDWAIAGAIRDYIVHKGRYPIEDHLRAHKCSYSSETFQCNLKRIIDWIDSGGFDETRNAIAADNGYERARDRTNDLARRSSKEYKEQSAAIGKAILDADMAIRKKQSESSHRGPSIPKPPRVALQGESEDWREQK